MCFKNYLKLLISAVISVCRYHTWDMQTQIHSIILNVASHYV